MMQRPRITAPRGQVCQAFTLIELLAAMGVLLILMLVLFQFFASAERIWTTSNATTDVYQKGRILMDIITRDLQGAVARGNDLPGSSPPKKICFEQVPPTPTDRELYFVSTASLGSSTGVETVVGYMWDPVSYGVLRTATPDASVGWDIYYDAGRTAAFLGGIANFETVVDGVMDVQFVCYDQAFIAQAWDGGNYETTLPSAVGVTVRLLDTQSLDKYRMLAGVPAAQAQVESENARTFSKVIFLGGRR